MDIVMAWLGALMRTCVLVCAAVACGSGPATSALAPSAEPSTVPTPRATATPPPAGCDSGFVVRGGRVTVRISERAGPVPIHEAVIESRQISGGFALAAPNTFAACSAVAIDLRGLRSLDEFPGEDVSNRDEVIHKDLLETEKDPFAILRPHGAAGVPGPLPTRGHWSFALRGELTLHGHTKDVTWSVQADRDGMALHATAKTAFAFDDFGIEVPNQILNLAEQIRLDVELDAEASP